MNHILEEPMLHVRSIAHQPAQDWVRGFGYTTLRKSNGPNRKPNEKQRAALRRLGDGRTPTQMTRCSTMKAGVHYGRRPHFGPR